MPYSEEVLDMPNSFRFPAKAVLLAMRSIQIPQENRCSHCEGNTYVVKNRVKIFCRACDGTGKKGGYGRHQPYVTTPPSLVFQIPDRSRGDYGVVQ